ncbi:hypothetical protein LK07_20590 [Streptomyces pluripotens]|uniref:Resolvase/invertase-type recombinase catalytic domain-containing protein n=1 Tax=Streptomyces pluripotens TaxID=1355015 RepID=A0A221P1G1_9ACTN|nr:hypothetical protein [Streptomyces pluripotens]ARP71754.1 hypothetical protein LK06_019425 [Streptomyces pluripotens]ASN26007.1 hypothetical protein LK07_20590 [Streptomyces pluripotens]
MRPTIYGYMRVAIDAEGSDEAEVIRRELATFADREGFALGDVFTESVRCAESAFEAMIGRLKQSDVKNVLVPSLWHFARLPGLQDAMRQHIERETGARIWIVQGQRR